jgi:hypothetical protein
MMNVFKLAKLFFIRLEQFSEYIQLRKELNFIPTYLASIERQADKLILTNSWTNFLKSVLHC